MRLPFRPDAKILIVDDERVNILLLEKVLDSAGYLNISSLTDPREVLELFLDLKPDILMLDLSMPYMNGFEVMAQLDEHLTDDFMPILVLTADATVATKQRVLEFGATDFLTKPFDNEEVLLRTRNLLDLRFHHCRLEEQVHQRTAELELANEQLRQARQEIEAAAFAKNQFIANISHELRTPVNGILGIATGLMHMARTATEYEKLSVICSSVIRIQGVLNDVLSIAMLDSHESEREPQPVDMDDLIQSVFELYSAEAHLKGLELKSVRPSYQIPAVKADLGRLQQILWDLVGNAIKFTQKGGVTVQWRWEESGAAIGLIVEVCDTGIGITKESLETIFDPFAQLNTSLSRAFGGVGLGLALTRKYAEKLGGELMVRSTGLSGTTFELKVPLERIGKATGDRGGVVGPGRIPNEGGQRVLVIDDNPLSVFFLKEMLESMGCEVLVAKDGLEGCEKRFREDPKLIFMDINMPICDGIQATRNIRQREMSLGLRAVRIVALSSNCSEGDRRLYSSAGIDETIEKPGTLGVFQAALAEVSE